MITCKYNEYVVAFGVDLNMIIVFSTNVSQMFRFEAVFNRFILDSCDGKRVARAVLAIFDVYEFGNKYEIKLLRLPKYRRVS